MDFKTLEITITARSQQSYYPIDTLVVHVCLKDVVEDNFKITSFTYMTQVVIKISLSAFVGILNKINVVLGF